MILENLIIKKEKRKLIKVNSKKLSKNNNKKNNLSYRNIARRQIY